MTGEATVVPWRRILSIMAAALVARPDLWWTGLGALRRLAAPGWWREPPRLPVPARDLWGFRMVTAYGRADAPPDPGDVITYLEWCRATKPALAGSAAAPVPGGAGNGEPPRHGRAGLNSASDGSSAETRDAEAGLG